MAKMKKEKIIKQETPAQRLSGIIKTCRNIMRKDKGMNGDGRPFANAHVAYVSKIFR